MRFHRFPGLAVLLLLTVQPTTAGVDMTPGMWEVTIEMNVPGMPSGNIAPEPFTYCLTPEDLIPVDEGNADQCDISDIRTVGNTVSWKMKCPSDMGAEMKGSGWITYKHTEFSGAMEIDMDIPGHAAVKMTQKYKGKYLGECAE